jgi:hypothetical protein
VACFTDQHRKSFSEILKNGKIASPPAKFLMDERSSSAAGVFLFAVLGLPKRFLF